MSVVLPEIFGDNHVKPSCAIFPDLSQPGFPSLLSPPPFPEVTQTRISGRLPPIDEHYRLERFPQMPAERHRVAAPAICMRCATSSCLPRCRPDF